MFDLKCKRQGCSFNKCCNCTAHHVEVASNTTCKTYEPSNNAEKQEVDKIPHRLVRMDTKVGCKANCLFNDGVKCCANGITVMTISGEPSCQTFMPK